MSESRSETRTSLIISSEVLPGRGIAEILGLEPSKIIVKGTPTGETDFAEHPFHIAMFISPLPFDARLEAHLSAVLDLCEQVRKELLTLMRNCRIAVHSTYLIEREGGWTITEELCRRMASLPCEYVFAVQPRRMARSESED